tara:strand:+ start:1414 stop:2634 length:1221 start_codon:yes stop_codon:yes gene_type:complete
MSQKEKEIKVAVYTGYMPSSLFIENTIKVISDMGIKVYLFGSKNSEYLNYNENIKIFSYPNGKFLRFKFVLINLVRLLIKNPTILYKIFIYFYHNPRNEGYSFIEWGTKFLPIIINLPDIIHIQWAKSLSSLFFLKEFFNVKIVLSLRGAHINYTPLASKKVANEYRTLFPLLDGFHAVSKTIAKEAMKYGAGGDKIKVVYSSIDDKKIKPYIKANLDDSNKIRFISVGRHHWKKGYSLSLSAIKNLIDNGYNIEYYILSSDEPSEEILYQINQLSLDTSVSLLTVNSQNQVYEHMREADCFLLSSVEEGVSNSVLEAMYIGLPVISSDCGGMDEIIINDMNGILFSSWDINSMINAMINFIERPIKLKRELAKNAKYHVQKRHNMIKHGCEMKILYEDVIENQYE